MELVPGQQVERYVVVSRIGAGHMSTTYSVRHTVLDTMHAMLVPNQPIKGLLRRLVAGAKIQARLRHPGVVSSTDVLDLDGMPALILDHVEGPSLRRFVQSHELDEKSIDAVATGLFDAVAFLHANSIVHRHLKPKNVIVEMGKGVVTPRISDFTLALVQGGTASMRIRKKPRVFGTPSYMAPEQTINSDLVDHKADLWSLGCILYYLATGEQAFDHPSAEMTFSYIQEGRYKPLKRIVSGAPSRWARAIEAALVVDEDERVDNAEALSDLWFEGVAERPQMSSKAAPVGKVTLVFTDIQGSTALWEKTEEVARHSLRAHDAVMRNSLHRHGGYEVKTEGDAFMVAFSTPQQALGFCIEVQRELYEHPWSDELLQTPEASHGPGFRGLRVRMGVHSGTPECRPYGERVDYFGPMVNRSARISGAGHGGQILVSGETWRQCEASVGDEVVAKDLGTYRLRGLAGVQELVQVLPLELMARRFEPVKAERVEEDAGWD